MALTPGTWLGPYEIAAQIGVGGMGVRTASERAGYAFAVTWIACSLSMIALAIARLSS